MTARLKVARTACCARVNFKMKVNIINYARGLTLQNACELGTDGLVWPAYEIEINLKRAREGSNGDPGHDSSPTGAGHAREKRSIIYPHPVNK